MQHHPRYGAIYHPEIGWYIRNYFIINILKTESTIHMQIEVQKRLCFNRRLEEQVLSLYCFISVKTDNVFF